MLIAEIAKKAKVSPATVSRAINQPAIVAPESLARIQAVMRQHNYRPAPIERRRGPKARKPDLRKIGVWFVGAKSNNPSLNWFQDQLLQIQSGNPRYRVDLSVLFSNTPDELPVRLADAKLDGIIIQGMEPSAACLARLSQLPHVWFMTRRSTTFASDFVEPNNEENGRIAAEYLKRRGHKSVAVITTDPDYSAIARRVRAFVQHAGDIGLHVHSILGHPNPGVSYLDQTNANAESDTLVRRFLASKPRPSGLYVPVDHFCGSFFRALREAGQQPGRDFDAVLGNFNPVIYHNLDHLPAVIDINLPTLVRKVVDHLMWRIENPGATGRVGITVSPTLIEATPANGSPAD